jgi:hypothetical protein
MSRNFTLLPIVCVVVIALLALFAISSERSNLPDITGNPDYPHHVCKFSNYCEGSICRIPTASRA